jgi:thioesterase domain-containing protein
MKPQFPLTDYESITMQPLRREGTCPPLFGLQVLYGRANFCSRLLPYLPPDLPVYEVPCVGLHGDVAPLETIEEMAVHQAKEIRLVQPQGPYYLCGYSMGMKIGVEIGRLLKAQYDETTYLIGVDGSFSRRPSDRAAFKREGRIGHAIRKLKLYGWAATQMPLKYKQIYLKEKVSTLLSRLHLGKSATPLRLKDDLLGSVEKESDDTIKRLIPPHQRASAAYDPAPYDGPVVYLRASGNMLDIEVLQSIFQICKGELHFDDIPGSHTAVTYEPHARTTGAAISKWLRYWQRDV